MPLSCLIVDDSKVVRKLLRRIMEELGFAVSEAEDGKKACDFCRAQKPKLIMLDWNMPEMDGIAFIRELRAMPDGNLPKVIFCTTESEVANIVEALNAGADEYVMKPFDADIIRGKLQHINIL